MYPKYFGLKEPSFSITPDPQYLFLSAQHREALAHLLYGAGEGGGFVLLTGEVGTGKTTVCRAFLEQLPDGVDIALVLNPAMTAVELLHAICDEFGVAVPPGERSVKPLVDALNRYLLDAHARGRRPVLIIDEAQNLRPKVMEQVRLLTNLETTKHKLLQIFLIGQPELRTLLASPDLRQLSQRITARYHLKPLGPRETAAYVEHRIAVAGVDRPLFTAAALKRVHRCSGGVPRLINLICDRALLGAAVSRRLQVTPEIVSRAAREVRGSADAALVRAARAQSGGGWRRLGIAAAVLLAAVGGAWVGASGLLDDAVRLARELVSTQGARSDTALAVASEPAEADDGDAAGAAALVRLVDVATPAAPEPSADAAPTESPEPVADAGIAAADTAPDPDAAAQPDAAAEIDSDSAADGDTDGDTAAAADDDIAADTDAAAPRIATARLAPDVVDLAPERLAEATVPGDGVVDELLRLWSVETAPGVRGLDCAAVPAFGLACERSKGRWSDLRRFDRPAALRLTLPDGREAHAVVGILDDEHALLFRDEAALRVPIAVLDERWSGDYLILWRPPPVGVKVIGAGSNRTAVAWLRQRLAALPEAGISAEPAVYDTSVRAAVRRFQGANGLVEDGVAGPRTLILLGNALTDADVPRLVQSR